MVTSACGPVVRPVTAADTPPAYPCSDRSSSRAVVRGQCYLEAIYGNLKYPHAAWEVRAEGVFIASYVIGKDGVHRNLRVRKVAIANTDSGERIEMIRFRIPRLESDHGPPVMPPLPPLATDAEREAGEEVLMDEIVRVLGLLKRYTPAYRRGRPIAVRGTTRFSFRLE